MGLNAAEPQSTAIALPFDFRWVSACRGMSPIGTKAENLGSLGAFPVLTQSRHRCTIAVFGDRAAFHDRRAEPSLMPRHARRQGHRLWFEAPGRPGLLCLA